jgi:septal ring factor EnvC (AmiA/AmiB activator)
MALIFFSSASQTLFAAQNTQQTKREVQSIQKLLKKLKVELKKERATRTKEEQALQHQEQKIALLASQISVIDKKLSNLNVNLKQYRTDQQSIQTKIVALEERLNVLIKQRYQMGDKTPLKLLINQQDPEHVSRMLLYFEKIHQHLNDQVVSYRKLISERTTTNANIDKTEQQLLKDKQLLAKQQTQLKDARAKRKKSLKAANSNIAKKKNKINKLAKDKKRLNRVILRIEKALAQDKRLAAKKAAQVKKQERVVKVVDNRPFKKMKGKLRWPVSGKLGRKFGSYENNLAYDGIFIKAKLGSPVKAVHTGTVVFSDWLKSYGMVLIVDHGLGYLTLYGHNDQLNKKAGQKVFPGEVIARAGSSGGNQRSGLYFAVRRNGKTTNPLPWLSRK